MRKLHVVGFTTDLDGLIFSTRKGSKSGSFVVSISDELREKLAEVERLRNGDEGEKTPAPAERSARREEREAARGRSQSELTPREIQARLRAGRTIDEVAREARCAREWVERFAAPILAEQAQVVELARGFTYSKARLGESVLPLGESVAVNLVDKGVLLPGDEFDAAWSAFQLHDGVWLVRFHYRSRGRVQQASWEVDLATGGLTSRDRLGSDLAYVDTARSRRFVEAAAEPPAEHDAAEPTSRSSRRPAARRTSAAKRASGTRPAARKAPAVKRAVRPVRPTRRAVAPARRAPAASEVTAPVVEPSSVAPSAGKRAAKARKALGDGAVKRAARGAAAPKVAKAAPVAKAAKAAPVAKAAKAAKAAPVAKRLGRRGSAAGVEAGPKAKAKATAKATAKARAAGTPKRAARKVTAPKAAGTAAPPAPKRATGGPAPRARGRKAVAKSPVPADTGSGTAPTVIDRSGPKRLPPAPRKRTAAGESNNGEPSRRGSGGAVLRTQTRPPAPPPAPEPKVEAVAPPEPAPGRGARLLAPRSEGPRFGTDGTHLAGRSSGRQATGLRRAVTPASRPPSSASASPPAPRPAAPPPPPAPRRSGNGSHAPSVPPVSERLRRVPPVPPSPPRPVAVEFEPELEDEPDLAQSRVRSSIFGERRPPSTETEIPPRGPIALGGADDVADDDDDEDDRDDRRSRPGDSDADSDAFVIRPRISAKQASELTFNDSDVRPSWRARLRKSGPDLGPSSLSV